MAQSTTIVNSVSMSISVGGTDICGTTASIDWSDDRQVAAFFTACGDGARHLLGKRTIAGTLNIYFSETAGEAFLVLVAAYEAQTESAIIVSPTGGGSGNQQWTFTALFTAMPMSFNPGAADPIAIAVPFVVQGTGARAAVV